MSSLSIKQLPTSNTLAFTLVEVVVAVFIFAIISVIVSTSLNNFLDLRERVSNRQDQIAMLQKTFLFLSRDLRFAANRSPKDEFGEPQEMSIKIDDDLLLSMTTSYPDASLEGVNVPRRVDWELQDGRLIRYMYPVMDPDSDTRRYRHLLLDGVDKVDFSASWVEDGRDANTRNWKEEGRLPDMLEITIVMHNDLEFTRLFTMQGGDLELANSTVSNQAADADNSLSSPPSN